MAFATGAQIRQPQGCQDRLRLMHSATVQLGRHPKLTGMLAAAAAVGGLYYWRLSFQKAALERAAALQRSIRIVKQRDPRLVARLLSHLFTSSVRYRSALNSEFARRVHVGGIIRIVEQQECVLWSACCPSSPPARCVSLR